MLAIEAGQAPLPGGLEPDARAGRRDAPGASFTVPARSARKRGPGPRSPPECRGAGLITPRAALVKQRIASNAGFTGARRCSLRKPPRPTALQVVPLHSTSAEALPLEQPRQVAARATRASWGRGMPAARQFRTRVNRTPTQESHHNHPPQTTRTHHTPSTSGGFAAAAPISLKWLTLQAVSGNDECETRANQAGRAESAPGSRQRRCAEHVGQVSSASGFT